MRCLTRGIIYRLLTAFCQKQQMRSYSDWQSIVRIMLRFSLHASTSFNEVVRQIHRGEGGGDRMSR